MAKDISSINLTSYQRLTELERRIWYSPLSIAVYAIGLAGAAYGFWNLRGGVAAIGPGIRR